MIASMSVRFFNTNSRILERPLVWSFYLVFGIFACVNWIVNLKIVSSILWKSLHMFLFIPIMALEVVITFWCFFMWLSLIRLIITLSVRCFSNFYYCTRIINRYCIIYRFLSCGPYKRNIHIFIHVYVCVL